MLQIDFDALAKADPRRVYLDALAKYPYMMTVDDAAEFLGQTRQAVTQYLRNGEMEGTKSGRAWRIPKVMFIEFLYGNANK